MKRLPIALITLSMTLLAGSHGWAQLTGRSLVLQDSSLPARKVTLRTPGVLSSSYSLIYPSALPGANGYLLTGTTSGQLSWADPATVVGSLAWLLNGNGSITVPTSDAIGAGQNFLGTTGAQELVLGTNSVRRLRVSGTTGNVGVGAAPSATERLNVHGMVNTDSAYNIANTNWLWAGPGLGGANNVLVGNTTNTALAADDNTLVGAAAGRDASTGIDNTFVGSNAGRGTTTGADNTYVGAFTGQLNPTGSANTFVGSSSGNALTSGDYNTIAGFASGNGLITGSYNTILGGGAATSLNSATRVTVVGAEAASNAQNNASAIGARAYVTADNSMVLGGINGVNGATADVNVGIGTTAPSQKLEVRNGNMLLSNSGAAGALRIQEPSASGADYTAFTAQAQAADIVYTLPAALPPANGYIMSTTTGGLLSWASPASVVGTTAWLLNGNNIAAGGTGGQFIGTTAGNTQPFVMATSGAERMRIDNTGRIMMGTTAPQAERLTVIDTVVPAAISDLFTGHMRMFFNPGIAWNSTNAANGLRADIVVKNSASVDGERIAGVIAAGSMDPAATAPLAQLRGLRGNIIQSNTTQTLGHGIAVEGNLQNGGLMTNATSFLAKMNNQAGSTTTTNRGLWMQQPDAGTVGTVIGVDIDQLTMAATNIALRYNHATSPVVITGAGSVGVGNAAPAQKLEVKDGNALISNSGTAGELRFQEPNASGSNYTAFKAQAQGSDATYTLPNALPAANDYVLTSSTGGSMQWQNPATINSGNFVQYNVPTPQGTAVAANRLFDVRYGGLGAGADALGARITSTSGTTASATGLTVASTANGTGTSTGLDVSASGGANNYAALFRSGNVGINSANPNSKLYVAETIGTANRDTQMVALWYTFNPTANPAPTVSVAGQIVRMTISPTSAQTSGLISGADIGSGLVATATAGAAQINGLRGFASNNSTTQTLTNAVGIMGHVQNSGLTTNGISFLANAQFLPGGTMTNYYGLRVENPSLSGSTAVGAFGISVEPITAGTTTNMAFRYNHGTFPTAIMGDGRVGFGTTAPTSYTEITAPAYTSTTTVPGTWTPFLAAKISQTVNPTGAVGATYHSLMAYDSLSVAGASNMATGVVISRLSRVRNFNTSALGEIRSIQANIHNEAAGNVTLADAVYADVSNNSNGTIATAIAYNSLMENVGSGAVTSATGFKTRPSVGSTGNITTFNGLHVDVASHTGTGRVQNYNGVVVSNIDAAEVTGTRNVLLYTGAGTNKSVAITGDGSLGLGTTTPTVSLDVDGGVVLREDASVTNVNADNFPITVGNRSYLRIGCTTAGAATTKTITLSAGVRVGQILVIEGTGFNSFEIDDNTAANRTNTPAARSMVNGSIEMMIWNGTSWQEVSFAQN